MTEVGEHFMAVETDRVYEVIEIDNKASAAWVQEMGNPDAPDETLDAMLWPVPIKVLENPDYYIPVVVTPGD